MLVPFWQPVRQACQPHIPHVVAKQHPALFEYPEQIGQKLQISPFRPVHKNEPVFARHFAHDFFRVAQKNI